MFLADMKIISDKNYQTSSREFRQMISLQVCKFEQQIIKFYFQNAAIFA